MTNPTPGPSYCAGRTPLSKPLNPAQWATCFKYGWNEPTTTAARLGHDFGHSILPALIVLAVIWLVVRAVIRR
jgi:hypothetical protein